MRVGLDIADGQIDALFKADRQTRGLYLDANAGISLPKLVETGNEPAQRKRRRHTQHDFVSIALQALRGPIDRCERRTDTVKKSRTIGGRDDAVVQTIEKFGAKGGLQKLDLMADRTRRYTQFDRRRFQANN